ncbi:MAG: hypothetical protein DME94_09300 [Verrucomicrobia bacterium]|nr:MAG: hypothetical protein DME94_09300 [Verrucomicrobiota bacterium]
MAEAADRRASTRATGVVGIAILSSRVLGLIREMVFAGLFGAGRNLDAFLMAFRLPNLLRDLFAEGALSTAFITTFSKKIAVEGDQSAWRLANKVATLTAVFMSGITLLGITFAPQLIDLLTWGAWSPDKTALTILLTRIMWPFMLLVSLAALVMGMLNAKHVFGPPAMASSYFNLGSIIAGVAIGYWLDPHFGARSLVGLAIGTLIGGAWQLMHGPDVNGTGRDRGQRGAGECFNQQRICSRPWKWPGELAQHCLSPDAIAAGNFWCGHRDSYVAAGVEERRAREHG